MGCTSAASMRSSTAAARKVSPRPVSMQAIVAATAHVARMTSFSSGVLEATARRGGA
jgi:homoserine kinase